MHYWIGKAGTYGITARIDCLVNLGRDIYNKITYISYFFNIPVLLFYHSIINILSNSIFY